jgi:hypothetical protein
LIRVHGNTPLISHQGFSEILSVYQVLWFVLVLLLGKGMANNHALVFHEKTYQSNLKALELPQFSAFDFLELLFVRNAPV